MNKSDMEERDRGSGSSGPNSGDPEADPAGSDARPNALKTVIAYTPGMSQRHLPLLRSVSFLLPCENQGQAYECSMNKLNVFLKWSKCSSCLFFEWVQKDKIVLCRMFNIRTGMHAEFRLNPAFSDEVFEVKVKNVALSFSSNFYSNKKWASIKDILTVIFGPHEDVPGPPEYLYTFTRIGDSVYIRVMKVGPYFCLMLTGRDVSSPVSVFLQSSVTLGLGLS